VGGRSIPRADVRPAVTRARVARRSAHEAKVLANHRGACSNTSFRCVESRWLSVVFEIAACGSSNRPRRPKFFASGGKRTDAYRDGPQHPYHRLAKTYPTVYAGTGLAASNPRVRGRSLHSATAIRPGARRDTEPASASRMRNVAISVSLARSRSSCEESCVNRAYGRPPS